MGRKQKANHVRIAALRFSETIVGVSVGEDELFLRFGHIASAEWSTLTSKHGNVFTMCGLKVGLGPHSSRASLLLCPLSSVLDLLLETSKQIVRYCYAHLRYRSHSSLPSWYH